jgi:hypothetical protein
MAYNSNSPLTGVPSKLSTEKKTYGIIDRILPNPRGWWIGLVGHAEELPRHIQMCKEIGIPSHRMMIVEQDEKIAYNVLSSKGILKEYYLNIFPLMGFL